jgi:nucleoside-diphosphate-sugar epimerase
VRAFVTGATGFLGSHIAEQLAARGDALRALARPASPRSHLDSLNVERCPVPDWPGETFSAIVDGARRELAARYVEDGGRPLAEVSALLGFSAPSAFSRWYRQGFGESAAQRRLR